MSSETDCFAASTTSYCISTENTCKIDVPLSELIPKCDDKYADYLHVQYRCVPCKISNKSNQ